MGDFAVQRDRDGSSDPARPLAGWLGLAALALSCLTFMLVRFRATGEIYPNDLLELVEGVGESPFQQRWFMWFVPGRLIESVVGENIKVLKQAYCAIDALALFAASLMFHRIALKLFKTPELAALATIWFVAGAFFQWALPRDLSIYFPYDLSALLVSAGALFVIFCAPRWRWILVPLVALACLNRETSLLLVPLFWFAFPRNERIAAIALSLAGWAAAYVVSRQIIAPAEATAWAQFYEGDQLRMIASLRRFASNPSALITMSMLAAYAWLPVVVRPLALRHTQLAIFFPSIAMGLGLFWLVGNLEEVRLYSEMLPMLTLQGSAILFSLWGTFDLDKLMQPLRDK